MPNDAYATARETVVAVIAACCRERARGVNAGFRCSGRVATFFFYKYR